MHLVDLLSVSHLPSRSNTKGSPKQTSIFPVGQPALLGHSSDENDLDTQWVCGSKHSTWITKGLEGPNEAFIGCLSNVMNRACGGQARYDWINSIFHWMVDNILPHQQASFGRSNRPQDCLFVMFACAVCALVNKFCTLVLSYGVGRQAWCP